jgi:hypothetical protein
MIGIAWETTSGRRRGRAPNFLFSILKLFSKEYKAGTRIVGGRKEGILLQDLETKMLALVVR